MDDDVTGLEAQAEKEMNEARRPILQNFLDGCCVENENENSVNVKITNPAANTQILISFGETMSVAAMPLPRIPQPVNHFPPPMSGGPIDLQNLVYQGGMPVHLTQEQRAAQTQPALVPTQPIPPVAPCAAPGSVDVVLNSFDPSGRVAEALQGSEPPLTPPAPFVPTVAPV